MCYQAPRQIGFVAPVLSGQGGRDSLHRGHRLQPGAVDKIWARVDWIAPCIAYPGEYEMQSLALNARLAVLRGEQVAKGEEWILRRRRGAPRGVGPLARPLRNTSLWITWLPGARFL